MNTSAVLIGVAFLLAAYGIALYRAGHKWRIRDPRSLILVVFLLMSAAIYVHAYPLPDDSGGPLRKGGGWTMDRSTITLGNFPMAKSTISTTCLADVLINTGDAVTIVTSPQFGTGYAEVTRSVTACDPLLFGVALTGVTSTGMPVRVGFLGTVLFSSAVSITAGTIYSASGTAGKLTPVSTCFYLALTNTSTRTVGRVIALQNQPASGGGSGGALGVGILY